MPIDKGRGLSIGVRRISYDINRPIITNTIENNNNPESPLYNSIVLAAAVGEGNVGYIGADGLGYPADSSSMSTAGEFIYTQDGNANDAVTIQFSGRINYTPIHTNFTVGSPVYLSNSGNVVLTEPSTNIWQIIGIADTADSFFADISEPIQL